MKDWERVRPGVESGDGGDQEEGEGIVGISSLAAGARKG